MKLWIGGVLLGVLLAAACGGGNVFSLKVGDCFNDDAGLAGEVADVDTVSCSERHDNEVYAVGDHPSGGDASYPGDDVLDLYAIGYCYAEFGAYVGISYEESRLDYGYFYPTWDSWREGDREISCFLYDWNLAKLTGSMKGTRE